MLLNIIYHSHKRLRPWNQHHPLAFGLLRKETLRKLTSLSLSPPELQINDFLNISFEELNKSEPKPNQ